MISNKIAIAAISPEVSTAVIVFASKVYDQKPTAEEVARFEDEVRTTTDELYVLVTATPDFVSSLVKDMPQVS